MLLQINANVRVHTDSKILNAFIVKKDAYHVMLRNAPIVITKIIGLTKYLRNKLVNVMILIISLKKRVCAYVILLIFYRIINVSVVNQSAPNVQHFKYVLIVLMVLF